MLIREIGSDILFMHIQENLQAIMAKYGKDNHPPAWDSFTLSNEFGVGNLHMVQKVFVGAFEVHKSNRILIHC